MSLTPFNRPAFAQRGSRSPRAGITEAQDRKYWRLWGAACRANDWHGAVAERQRHAAHVKALGYDKSHKLFTNPELDKVFPHFELLANPVDLDAAIESADPTIGERRRLVNGIGQRLPVLGGEAYLTAFLDTEQQYAAFVETRGRGAWRELPIGLLRSLHMTVVHRARSRGVYEDGVEDSGKPF